MIGLALLKLSAAILSLALAAGILARDHELRANRLIAAFLFCNAWWASAEFFLYGQRGIEPGEAVFLYRIMCLGWLPLGVFCMHASLALSAMEDHPVARSIPFFYAGVGLCLPAAVLSSFVFEGAEATRYGWRPIFGLGFPIAYFMLVAPVVSILTCWRGMISSPGSGGQAQLSRIVFFGLSGSLVIGTITAVVLPLLEIPAFGLTTNLIALVGLLAGFTLRRYGHALISPEAFAREILDTLEDGVVLLGEQGVVRDANRAFLRMVGEREAAVIGRRITDWVPELSSAPESIETSALMELRLQSGESVPVVVSSPVACAASRRRLGWAFLFRDRREVLSLQRRLVLSARLAAVGDLSKSISRAIEEPVECARRELERLESDWHDLQERIEAAGGRGAGPEAVREGLELIDECLEGVDRISSIVDEVGRFSTDRSREDFESHSLADIAQQALRIARAQASEAVEIESRLDDDVRVECHRPRLERVVTNLLVNAIQAFEGAAPGRAHIAVAVAARGDRAVLHVEDDGCGIEEDVLERIFDPFFTTKPVGKGTGLGLAISYHIVRDHGGEIRVSSLQDRGTSVTVELPLARTKGKEVG